MKTRRTQIFKESWAHVRGSAYPNVYTRLPGEKEALEDARINETVPLAYAWFWGMVGKEMGALKGVYFQ